MQSDATDEEKTALLMDMFAPEPLNEELVPFLAQGRLGNGIFHPLIHDPFYHEAMNKRINAMFMHKTEAVAKAIEEGRWSSMLFLHERPYRLDALEEILYTHEIDDPEIVWPLVGNVWTDSENINQNLEQWREVWDSPIPRRFELVMDEDERAALAALPETFEIYRGMGDEAAIEGMSWTTNKAKAEWFAHRFSGLDSHAPHLATGTVSKVNVLAHFLGRGEAEIVVLPENVQGQKVTRLRKKVRK